MQIVIFLLLLRKHTHTGKQIWLNKKVTTTNWWVQNGWHRKQKEEDEWAKSDAKKAYR